MNLRISDTIMTGHHTDHTARPVPGRQHEWEVSWLPDKILDGNAAVTAMLLADIAGRGDLTEGHRLWPHIHSWAAELGLTGPEAVTAASQPPSDLDREHARASGQSDPEAAD